MKLRHTFLSEVCINPTPKRIKTNLTGRQIGRLTVLGYYGRLPNRKSFDAYWCCQCECGRIKLIQGASLVRPKSSLSCGCLTIEKTIARGAGMRKRPEYSSYAHAKARCENPNNHKYPQYGKLGIRFQFISFKEFFLYLGERPSIYHTLDRFPDRNGHYEKGNVRWATPQQQQRNRHNTLFLTVDGITKSLMEWSEQEGISDITMRSRKQAGWCDTCIVRVPVNRKHNKCSHR